MRIKDFDAILGINELATNQPSSPHCWDQVSTYSARAVYIGSENKKNFFYLCALVEFITELSSRFVQGCHISVYAKETKLPLNIEDTWKYESRIDFCLHCPLIQKT